jgi:hypothetical protein
MKHMIIGVTLAGFAAFTPLNAQRPSGNQRGSRQDCTNSQRTSTVSDIIFGRSGNNTTNCVDNRGNQVNGGWYQVGRDGNGGTIYERQTRDSNGNVIIQRARRDAYGNMSIISTRNVGNNGTYNNGRYNDGRNNNGTYNGRRRGDGDGDGDEDDQGNYQNGRRRGNDNQNGRGHGNKSKDKNKNHHDGD